MRRRLYWSTRPLWLPVVQARFIVLAAIIVAALIVIFSVAAFRAEEPDTGWNWLIALVSTLVSALLAIVAGFALFMSQASLTEKQRKREMVTLLSNELQEMLIEMQENRDPKHPKREIPYFQPKPKESEIRDEVLHPENHETDFPYRHLYPRFLELVYESGLMGGWLETDLSYLIKAIQEYNTQLRHLRALSVAHDGSEVRRKRYGIVAVRVLSQEKKVARLTRSVLKRLEKEEIS